MKIFILIAIIFISTLIGPAKGQSSIKGLNLRAQGGGGRYKSFLENFFEDFQPSNSCGPTDLISKFVDRSLLVVADLHLVTHKSAACEKAAYAATAMRDTFRMLPECQKHMVCEVQNQLRRWVKKVLVTITRYLISENAAPWPNDFVLLKEVFCEDSACEKYDEIYGRHPLTKKLEAMTGNRRYIRQEVDEALIACGSGEEDNTILHLIWASISTVRRFGGVIYGCVFPRRF